MRTFCLLFTLWCAWVALVTDAQSQPYIFETIAGAAGQIGTNDGTGGAARFHNPEFLATDAGGNVYVSDMGNNAIRRLTPTESGWTVRTLAGNPPFGGSADGTNGQAQFASPKGIVVDEDGNVFVADYENQLIRKLTASGTNWVVTTIASTPRPWGLARDATGNLYVTDYFNRVIRRIAPVGTNWVSTVLAGTPLVFGTVDGTDGDAQFSTPEGLAVDSVGNLYLGELWSYTIRKITPVGPHWVVTTIAGAAREGGGADGMNSEALFRGPRDVATDGTGVLFVADAFNQAIRKVMPVGTNWVVTTVGGLPGFENDGSADGIGNDARFKQPGGVAVDGQGNLYVADTSNSTIRRGHPLTLAFQVNPLAHQVAVSWSLLATGFVLETTTSLAQGSPWAVLSNGVAISGGSYVVTNEASGPAAYYRLRR